MASTHRDAPAVEVVQQAFDDLIWVASAHERPVDQVDTQRTDRLLLELGCVVEHANVDQDLIRRIPAKGTRQA